MASKFNIKTVHNDGKSELKIGIDENSKLIEGEGKRIIIKNADGSDAIIAKENIIGMPDDVSETNKLVTQNDLNKMSAEIQKAFKAQAESMESLIQLYKIVGNISEGGNE